MQQAFYLTGSLINPAELTITNNHLEPVSVQQKPMEVLVYLAEYYPSLVSRQQLIDSIWLGNNYVGEKALTNAIWQLRNALPKHNAEELILTVRKKGYRLTAAPEFTAVAASQNENIQLSKHKWSIKWPLILLLLFVLIALAWHNKTVAPIVESAELVKVTNGVGRAMSPAISPNGRFLVFTWRKLASSSDLYLIDLQDLSYTPKQLTFSVNDESRALWSKDNRTIYYSSKTPVYGDCQIMRLDTLTLAASEMGSCIRHSRLYMDESPDGRYLIYSGKPAADNSSLYLVDLQNPEAEPSTLPCNDTCQYRARDVAFSPDSKYLALTRRVHRLSEDLYLLNLTTGEEEQITHDQEDILGMSWHPDSQRLVYAALRYGKQQGFMFDLKDKQHHDLNIENFTEPSKITANGELYFYQSTYLPQLGYLPVNQGVPAGIVRLTPSDARYEAAHYSAANTAIAYVSNESGDMEIWMSDPNMEQRTQLTQLNGMVKYPKWSYDGRFIAFVGRLPEQHNDKLMLLEVATGKLSQLNTGVSWHGKISWWYDDSAVIYSHDNNLYKISIASGEVEQLTVNGGVMAQMPANNQFYFSKGRNRGLWQLLPDKTEKMLLPDDVFSARIAWTYADDGIYFVQQREQKTFVSLYDLQTATTQNLILLPPEMLHLLSVMSFDSDHNRLLLELSLQPRADIYKLKHPLLQ
ncbi:winged helix-turn-helix domain-containing protein [Rheinheimera sp. MMS21-TC3]|uniref:winged helix-turn-helix domain-containing protein n=1 Tax=Rheinheimera sp. MMS21-TC3 TaxID=3072790 RepID=UPI0028C4C678|nr:winged helix-turn-helix domain-containing protein [Rheinheimera sp. MMS21-TC3]WNO59817.1 winged helix-turn-helix domain-containing protein [Rheinheimera sp. MMS21-TC3]